MGSKDHLIIQSCKFKRAVRMMELNEVIALAIELDEEHQPSFGTWIEDVSGNTVWNSENKIQP